MREQQVLYQLSQLPGSKARYFKDTFHQRLYLFVCFPLQRCKLHLGRNLEEGSLLFRAVLIVMLKRSNGYFRVNEYMCTIKNVEEK